MRASAAATLTPETTYKLRSETFPEKSTGAVKNGARPGVRAQSPAKSPPYAQNGPPTIIIAGAHAHTRDYVMVGADL